jgi:L-iditol 2-dehydrogenase
MATPPHDGALAEYVAWPADFVSRLPDAVSTREGALCEPLSVGVHAARRGGVGLGDSVLVTGCGPIGLLAADAARAAGATDVVVSDVVASKLDRARERGTDLAVDASVEAVPETVRDHTGGGVDVAVEASGSPAGIETAVASVRRGGDVVLVGLPGGDGTVPVDVLSLVDDELDVHGSFRYANTYPAAVSLFADGTVDGESLVDETFPLGSVDEAFGRAAAPETAKVVVSVA